MPVFTLAVQNNASVMDMGVATSSVNFFRSLGSAFGVAAFGAVVRSRMASTVNAAFPDGSVDLDSGLLGSPAAIRELPPDQFAAVSEGVASGVSAAFVLGVPLMVVVLAMVIFLPEIPLRDAVEDPLDPPVAGDVPGSAETPERAAL
jgi:hypothetical protein